MGGEITYQMVSNLEEVESPVQWPLSFLATWGTISVPQSSAGYIISSDSVGTHHLPIRVQDPSGSL